MNPPLAVCRLAARMQVPQSLRGLPPRIRPTGGRYGGALFTIAEAGAAALVQGDRFRLSTPTGYDLWIGVGTDVPEAPAPPAVDWCEHIELAALAALGTGALFAIYLRNLINTLHTTLGVDDDFPWIAEGGPLPNSLKLLYVGEGWGQFRGADATAAVNTMLNDGGSSSAWGKILSAAPSVVHAVPPVYLLPARIGEMPAAVSVTDATPIPEDFDPPPVWNYPGAGWEDLDAEGEEEPPRT